MTAVKQLEELDGIGIDRRAFEKEVMPANRPVVLRGLLRDWPAVRAAQESASGVVDYFRHFDNGAVTNAMVGPPDIEGRFFYSDDYRAFNFGTESVSISVALDTLLSLAREPRPPSIALQAMHTPDSLPLFSEENRMPLLDEDIAPRVWISNRSIVAPHFDNNHNIACVVSGRRRFTVFPPEQVSNLYIGPLLRTPGGSPISVVDLRNPDYARFPRFREALDAAEQAVLEPGDAIYIPVLWWHGVESLDALNILVNYWWNRHASRHKPILALIYSMALMSGLPADQRQVWRTFFDHFVFQSDGDPREHLPSDLPDVMGKLSAAEVDQLIAYIRERMQG